MKSIIRNAAKAAALISLLSIAVFAQQVRRTPFDVQGYRMDVQLEPDAQVHERAELRLAGHLAARDIEQDPAPGEVEEVRPK